MSSPQSMSAHAAFLPGSGRRAAPRAVVDTDAATMDLTDGRCWRFRYSPRPLAPLDFLDDDWSAADWASIVLPAHWCMPGQPGGSAPSYTNVVYPIPLEPPHVPDENPTGDHVLDFDLPRHWPTNGHTHLRTEGIESFARIWLNGVEVGTRLGSRLQQDFDVTGLLEQTGNRLAVRVEQWSVGTYLEDQDQWWLPGIFRGISLRHRPPGALRDVWLDGDFHEGQGILRVQIDAEPQAWPVRIQLPELGIDVQYSQPTGEVSVEVGAVVGWSAEEPRRYLTTVSSRGERVTLWVGFRRVEIRDGVLLVNSRPVTLRGVNRHEFDPARGRAIDLETSRSELLAMKAANVDAVRTAHYPPDPRWLDLADELGVWVVLECDLETHGFEYSHWQGNPSDDPRWRDMFIDRIERTFERDKNHPSVIIWSLGNESGDGCNLEAMADWLHARDTSRPILYEGDRAGRYTDLYSRMYPALEEIHAWQSGTGPVAVAHHPASGIDADAAGRVRSMPYVMVEYLHAMGTGPGGAALYADIVESDPRIAGGFVWEWKDHAIAVPDEHGGVRWSYGGDFQEPTHDGNFVCDGLVSADLRPRPGLADWAETVAPVRARWADGAIVVDSRRQFISADDLELRWRFEIDGQTHTAGELSLEGLAADRSRTLEPPELLAAAMGRSRPPGAVCVLILEICQVRPRAWAPAGHVISRRWYEIEAPRGVVAVQPPAAGRPWGHDVAFDESGRLLSIGRLRLRDHGIDLWRVPTDNDEGHGALDYEAADPRTTLGAGGGKRGPSSADRWRKAGLDRLITRTVRLSAGEGELRVERRLAPANAPFAVLTRIHWTRESAPAALVHDVDPQALSWVSCHIQVSPLGAWPGTWPRVGLHLELPRWEALQARWFGLGPGESWADQRAAVWLGRHALPAADLVTPYVRPQASGYRSHVRELVLQDADSTALVVHRVSGPLGFSLSSWGPRLGAVGHQHELPRPSAWHLHLDLAQHGVGSRACGPDVRPDAQLWPRELEARFLLGGPAADPAVSV